MKRRLVGTPQNCSGILGLGVDWGILGGRAPAPPPPPRGVPHANSHALTEQACDNTSPQLRTPAPTYAST